MFFKEESLQLFNEIVDGFLLLDRLLKDKIIIKMGKILLSH